MIDKTYNLDVKYDKDGEAFIELPEEIQTQLNLKVGDEMVWNDNKDGSWSLTKKKKNKLVLVETISTFKHQYVVEVPEDGEDEWALDTVVMEEAVEFSQKHLDETVFSHRVVTEQEALEICDKENDYAADWPKEKKIETFFTPWSEL